MVDDLEALAQDLFPTFPGSKPMPRGSDDDDDRDEAALDEALHKLLCEETSGIAPGSTAETCSWVDEACVECLETADCPPPVWSDKRIALQPDAAVSPSVVAHSVHRRILTKAGLLFVVRVERDAPAAVGAGGASPQPVLISPELASRASLIW